MKPIEAPAIDVIYAWLNCDDHGLEGNELKRIFELAISYANTQIATDSIPKRPLLGDDDIDKETDLYANPLNGDVGGKRGFKYGARWARDKYEQILNPPTPKPWTPAVGQWIKGWDGDGSDTEPVVGEFSGRSSQLYLILREGKVYQRSFCALIETIDEIGKPPSYFIERGKCMVAK